jgi:hypothetical protein
MGRVMANILSYLAQTLFYLYENRVMKNCLFLLFICLSFNASSQAKMFRDIVGTWEITGEQKASLQIIDSTTIILNYMGEKKTITNYTFDFSKTPIWFDFSTSDSGTVLHVKSLLHVLGDDIIKWQLFIDEERPAHFSSTKGELLYLRKSRPTPAVVSN